MIGVSCTGFCAADPEEIMDVVSREFDWWEIFSEFKHDVTKFSARFNEIKGSYRIGCSVHAPICDINIAAVNERIRNTSTEETIRTMEHANRMGIEMITIHPGTYSTSLGNVRDRSVEHSKSSLKEIERWAYEYGVTAAIENMPSFRIMMGQTPEELLELLDGTDLKICFDIGHANTIGAIDRSIELFGERIVNVHIHDNTGKNDDHLTIGDGSIDFARVLPKLSRYRGNYIIEARSIESAILSKKRLKSWLR
ncbi:endonuclease 4 [Candidatus Methanoplasma termitum]|uniref:Nfo1 protein n=1 Tax=Candidatus Methanoplasma termitum TaxID=1577791 RepID=A0A0A7LDP4_9ARCH|nr:sugar phosphate isomerase/epimerase family protein [Candidatus Methanoplasma termitum]AIZ57083.1 endonuclease 4 [Candidatus Methanoplasma termitum]MCL2333741.1 sugar phosphate isomerase/epimerase [Candidatus Methanoplasma sp.]